MPFKDFAEFADPPLELPYRGKVYTVQPVTIDAGATLSRVFAGDDELKGKPTEWLYQLVLGATWDEMHADGVPATFAARAGLTALTDFQYGRALAEAAWEKGADPKALEAYLIEKVTPPPSRASRRSTSTGGARKTR